MGGGGGQSLNVRGLRRLSSPCSLKLQKEEGDLCLALLFRHISLGNSQIKTSLPATGGFHGNAARRGGPGHRVGSGGRARLGGARRSLGHSEHRSGRWWKGEGRESSRGEAEDQSAPTPSRKEEEKVGVYPVDFPSLPAPSRGWAAGAAAARRGARAARAE